MQETEHEEVFVPTTTERVVQPPASKVDAVQRSGQDSALPGGKNSPHATPRSPGSRFECSAVGCTGLEYGHILLLASLLSRRIVLRCGEMGNIGIGLM